MAHNERHQSPTCPSGHPNYQPATKAQLTLPSDFRHQLEFHHPVTNPLLKPSSRLQVTFVTNSSSISRGSGTGPGHANRGRDCSLSKLARPCSLREPNPTYGSQFGLAVCPLAQGELETAFRRHSERFPHTYDSAAPLQAPPSPLGVVGVAPGHSREFPTFSPGTSRGRISLTRYLMGVFFSLLESSSL